MQAPSSESNLERAESVTLVSAGFVRSTQFRVRYFLGEEFMRALGDKIGDGCCAFSGWDGMENVGWVR